MTVVTYSRQVHDATAVADKLAKENISVEVIDLRTIAPLDMPTVLESVRKTGRALIVHEAVKRFGVGAEIASQLNETLFGQLKAPVVRLGGAFCPVPFSKPLETAFIPGQADMEAAIRKLLA